MTRTKFVQEIVQPSILWFPLVLSQARDKYNNYISIIIFEIYCGICHMRAKINVELIFVHVLVPFDANQMFVL